MTFVLIASFLITVLSGPAFDDFRAADVADRDQARARVVYLPSARCRPRSFDVR